MHMERHLGFVSVQQRNGTVTIPVQARRALGLDRPGAQVEVVLRDGELVLVPYVAVPAETAWFWTEGHQSVQRTQTWPLADTRTLTMPRASSQTWSGSPNGPSPLRTNEVPAGSLVSASVTTAPATLRKRRVHSAVLIRASLRPTFR